MEQEPKEKIFLGRNDSFNNHTGDEWDEIADKETRPTEQNIGPKRENRPVDKETANRLFAEAHQLIRNGPDKKIYEITPHEPVNDMDRYALEEMKKEEERERRRA